MRPPLIIQSAAHEDANIIFGAVLDEKMKDEVKITVIATGFRSEAGPRASDFPVNHDRLCRDSAGAAGALGHASTRAADHAPRRCRLRAAGRGDGFPRAPPEAESISPASPLSFAERRAGDSQPPAQSSTRIWEAVQPPRPVCFAGGHGLRWRSGRARRSRLPAQEKHRFSNRRAGRGWRSERLASGAPIPACSLVDSCGCSSAFTSLPRNATRR